MAAILGLRGTGSFTFPDERPKNYREKILQLFPNGEAPLTALLSMLKAQPTDDFEYNWWEKRLPLQRMLQVGGALSTDVTINVASHAKDAIKGSILLVERTGERLFVDQDPTTDPASHGIRSFGTTSAAALLADDGITVIGNANPQGGPVPTPRAYAPDKPFNNTQIFRTPLSLTRTARRTRLRWDNTGPYREARREALQLHSIEMEKA